MNTRHQIESSVVIATSTKSVVVNTTIDVVRRAKSYSDAGTSREKRKGSGRKEESVHARRSKEPIAGRTQVRRYCLSPRNSTITLSWRSVHVNQFRRVVCMAWHSHIMHEVAEEVQVGRKL